MTRRLWAKQQARHRRDTSDELANLVSLRERVVRLRVEHPEWFQKTSAEQSDES